MTYKRLPKFRDVADPLLKEVFRENGTRRFSWQNDAQCEDKDAEKFNPTRGKSAKAAKALCSVCDVQLECFLSFGDESDKVYGGTSSLDRKIINPLLMQGMNLDQLAHLASLAVSSEVSERELRQEAAEIESSLNKELDKAG